MAKKTNLNLTQTNYKWLKWEFWPFWVFYFPVYFLYLYYGVKARSFGFFTASNPVMELGGWNAYSKHNVLQHIDTKHLPKSKLLIPPFNNNSAEQLGFNYPLILKPDKGERGFSVQKINNKDEFDHYLANSKQAIIIQEYIDYPIELGIMYHRLPEKKNGVITSIVRKENLSVRGDGQSTLKALIEKGDRTSYHSKMLFELYSNDLNSVIPKGDLMSLTDIGNHCRGATFYNANHLINDRLHEVFDEIANSIKGYYFGRFDLKVPSTEDLYAGKNIKILELNGANSEPTHIYDPEMPITKAYRDLFKHWKILYEVSTKNHALGVPYTSIWEVIREKRKYFKER